MEDVIIIPLKTNLKQRYEDTSRYFLILIKKLNYFRFALIFESINKIEID